MRRVIRLDLKPMVSDWLQAKTEEVLKKGTLEPERIWESARRNRNLKAVHQTLTQMAGRRERCMYCMDSQGTDIEHFWPKSKYPERMFYWMNLLLCCPHCGRLKGNAFPLDHKGNSLLIDPSIEDPWEFLDLDPETGNITARFDLDLDRFSEKGEATVQILRLDRREALAIGYLKTLRRLERLVQGYLDGETFDDFLQDLLDEDEHGLLGWCLRGSGKGKSPFKELKTRFCDLWEKCLESVP